MNSKEKTIKKERFGWVSLLLLMVVMAFVRSMAMASMSKEEVFALFEGFDAQHVSGEFSGTVKQTNHMLDEYKEHESGAISVPVKRIEISVNEKFYDNKCTVEKSGVTFLDEESCNKMAMVPNLKNSKRTTDSLEQKFIYDGQRVMSYFKDVSSVILKTPDIAGLYIPPGVSARKFISGYKGTFLLSDAVKHMVEHFKNDIREEEKKIVVSFYNDLEDESIRESTSFEFEKTGQGYLRLLKIESRKGNICTYTKSNSYLSDGTVVGVEKHYLIDVDENNELKQNLWVEYSYMINTLKWDDVEYNDPDLSIPDIISFPTGTFVQDLDKHAAVEIGKNDIIILE